MNTTLPILPLEIVNKILILRPTHPIADNLKNNIKLHHHFITYTIPYINRFPIESKYDDDCSHEFYKFIINGYTDLFF